MASAASGKTKMQILGSIASPKWCKQNMGGNWVVTVRADLQPALGQDVLVTSSPTPYPAGVVYRGTAPIARIPMTLVTGNTYRGSASVGAVEPDGVKIEYRFVAAKQVDPATNVAPPL